MPEHIYNSHYGNAVNVYLLVLSSWKVNIAENPFAVMGLKIRSGVNDLKQGLLKDHKNYPTADFVLFFTEL